MKQIKEIKLQIIFRYLILPMHGFMWMLLAAQARHRKIIQTLWLLWKYVKLLSKMSKSLYFALHESTGMSVFYIVRLISLIFIIPLPDTITLLREYRERWTYYRNAGTSQLHNSSKAVSSTCEKFIPCASAFCFKWYGIVQFVLTRRLSICFLTKSG